MIRQQYQGILERVSEAALRAGRNPAEVRVMAVSKTVALPQLQEAMEAGAVLFGENKVQELERKREHLPEAEMHLIGHLQSNKAAKAAACANMIQSVDSLRIAGEISRACSKLGKVMPILVEVNIGREESKFGILPEQTEAVLAEIAMLPGVSVQGLMTVPPFLEEKRALQKFFSQMRQLFIDIHAKKMDNITMGILSMGMSADFELAIAEGSTLVRVGSAIFGSRNYR